VGSPDDSEEEDTGDYDNVIGLIAGQDETNTSHKSRSRNSSYADLQRLRLAPLPIGSTDQPRSAESTSPGVELDGLHFPRSTRHRKASLSDGVPVKRIAALDPGEPFISATDGLNDEIRQKKAMDGHSQ
jgi:glycerol-3-phosphate O-acyltransferase/dihydroxyacetone phosphate acyltransferase